MLGSSAQANAELPPQNRLSGIVNNLAKRIFKGERITYDPELLASTATTLLNAMTTGYGKSLSDVDYDTPDFNTLRKLTENVFQFSASKDFHILQDMTLALKDTDGKLRSFSDFQKEVDKMNLQYNGNWLRTEYNHAVAASQCAARWTEQVSRSQSMPYLQYQAVMDSNTRPEHAALNGVIKRIDSDFWDKYYPPNGWGCRCEVIQLPGKNHKETPDMDLKHCKVAPMFQVNVGKKGVIFPKGHPYFMSQCQRCNGTPKQLAINPQCAACQEGRKMAENMIETSTNKRNWSDFENNKNYKPIPGEKNIYAPVGRSSEPDFNDKLIVARTAVEHGYRVWILGKTGKRNPDLLFERKGVYHVYDLKRVTSINSLKQDLIKSEGQTDRVLLKMDNNSNPRVIINAIKKYFEKVSSAKEVLIFKGKSQISIPRNFFSKNNYYNRFTKMWK